MFILCQILIAAHRKTSPAALEITETSEVWKGRRSYCSLIGITDLGELIAWAVGFACNGEVFIRIKVIILPATCEMPSCWLRKSQQATWSHLLGANTCQSWGSPRNCDSVIKHTPTHLACRTPLPFLITPARDETKDRSIHKISPHYLERCMHARKQDIAQGFGSLCLHGGDGTFFLSSPFSWFKEGKKMTQMFL